MSTVPRPERIDELLAERHAKDVWVPGCAMGSRQGGCRELDGWALLKTWSPWTTIGYEVKRSRSDFMRDRKWQDYLPVCHEFYFVCPAKLIAPEELPADIGLIWAGARLLTKRKAVHREPDPKKLNLLMSYVLMSRSRIVADMHEAAGGGSPLEFWRHWLASGAESKELGWMVGRKIRERLSEAEAGRRSAELERDRLDGIRQVLERLGFGSGVGVWEVERNLQKPNLEQLRKIEELARQIVREAKA